MKLRACMLLALAACAPTRGAAYETARAEALRAFGEGRFAQAAERYEQAAKDAKVKRDAVYMRYEAAIAWLRAGDVPRAEQGLRALASESTPYAPMAALKLTELAKTDEERFAALDALVVRFPDDGVAIVAALRIARHDDAAGPAAAIAHLESLAARTTGKKVEQTLAYERAKRIEQRDPPTVARDAYLAVADRWPYPFGVYFDDALYRASHFDQKLGRPNEAIATLERLLSKRETSTFLGSYERPKYVPALLRIAAIYEDELHDRAKARATLHRLYQDFPTSPLRDDALWREAALYQADGDAKTACERLSTLTHDFPDSRYVPCVVARCAGVERPSKSKAPKTCHAYIERGQGASQPEHPSETAPDASTP